MPQCTATGVSTVESPFVLPAMSKPLHNLGGSDGSDGCTAYQNWNTFDLTGDGVQDLILTRHCSDPTVGVDRWLVYAGTASGFATTASMFSLPTLTKPLHTLAGSDGSDGCTAYQNWTAIDLTGDDALDLVLTRHCSDTTVGVGRWLIYPGTTSGFAATSSVFSLPGLVKPLHTMAGSDGSAGCTAYQNWSTLDVSGDGTLDLVLTRHCSDPTVGVGAWLVYPGTASGFAATSSMFSLPGLVKPLHTTAGSDGSAGCTAYQNWSTFDLTGDGASDLVLTRHCSDATVGVGHWLVYPGTANGFAATNSMFSLPALTKPLHTIGGSDGSTGCTAYQNWSTFDLTGDGTLDLVLTRHCTDSAVGIERWSVYSGVCEP
ncbi:MAG: hypothetical protein H0T42_05990 [Deltaproteobacteria bacterium]|nr:hypothetical protein [Deltaproteobacteria bacterium]